MKYLIMRYKEENCNYIERKISLIGYSDSQIEAQAKMLEDFLDIMGKYGYSIDDYDEGNGYGDEWCMEDDSMSAWLSVATEGYYWEIVGLNEEV